MNIRSTDDNDRDHRPPGVAPHVRRRLLHRRRSIVAARGRGTATGPFFGAPSGRPLDFTVIDVARVVDGRIVEHWGVPDRFAVLAQTGVLARLA
jgi:predicted ester cyclase